MVAKKIVELDHGTGLDCILLLDVRSHGELWTFDGRREVAALHAKVDARTKEGAPRAAVLATLLHKVKARSTMGAAAAAPKERLKRLGIAGHEG